MKNLKSPRRTRKLIACAIESGIRHRDSRIQKTRKRSKKKQEVQNRMQTEKGNWANTKGEGPSEQTESRESKGERKRSRL